ncbi:amidase family protein [Alkalicoccus halolimnae]|uniref:Amidase family protein n=1 Tax=Alkalicoccus halolimnae TaxID=1667239 RepID=A0A5C7FMS4_9BACI|nr:amidase family protein [Alkalicoccus halolimnae]TXF86065.1 amidase [Alkalicoccus halolimnae]
MKQSEYIENDAAGLAEKMKNGDVSAAEVFQAFQERLEKVNPSLNAVVRTRLEKAEKETFSKNAPLAGVPFLTKDLSQAIKGERLTAGSKLLNKQADRNSYLVDAFQKAGLRIGGQTNTPEFGLKNITEPKRFGPVRNPHDTSFSAGGSSGGAAAAVAAGIVPTAGASDGGGSIRIPASFTGIFGLKPTRGRTPVSPGSGRQWQGAAVGFAVSRTVRDSAVLLKETQTLQLESAFPFPEIDESDFVVIGEPVKKKLRIAFSCASPQGTTVSREARQAVRETASFLKDEGHNVEEAAPEINGTSLIEQYYLMNSGEMASVTEQLEAAFGRKLDDEELELESWMLKEAGRFVTAAAYTQSLQAWDTASAAVHDFHDRYDIYLTPAAASSAPKAGELTYSRDSESALREKMKQTPNKQELIYEMFAPSLAYTPFTQLANLTGQPAVSMPLGEDDKGMPIGVQAMAAKGEEILLLQAAAMLEQSSLWKQRGAVTPEPLSDK